MKNGDVVEVCGVCAERQFREPCTPETPCHGTEGGIAFVEKGHCLVCRDLTYLREIQADITNALTLLLLAPRLREARAAGVAHHAPRPSM